MSLSWCGGTTAASMALSVRGDARDACGDPRTGAGSGVSSIESATASACVGTGLRGDDVVKPSDEVGCCVETRGDNTDAGVDAGGDRGESVRTNMGVDRSRPGVVRGDPSAGAAAATGLTNTTLRGDCSDSAPTRGE